MATATFPPDVSVSIPSTTLETPSLNPPATCFTRSSTAGSWNYRPWEPMRATSPICSLELLNENARKGRLGRVFVELLFRIDVARGPQAASGRGVRVGGAVAVRQTSPQGRSLGHGPRPRSRGRQQVQQGRRDRWRRSGDYFRTGTRLVWVVYPRDASGLRLHFADRCPNPARAGGSRRRRCSSRLSLSLNRLFEDEPDADGTSWYAAGASCWPRSPVCCRMRS